MGATTAGIVGTRASTTVADMYRAVLEVLEVEEPEEQKSFWRGAREAAGVNGVRAEAEQFRHGGCFEITCTLPEFSQAVAYTAGMSAVSHSPRQLMAGTGFAFVAGFVDALAFMFLGGVFLSFMSGNVTRIAASAVTGDWATVQLAATCVVLFLLGVMEGALVRRLASRRIPRVFVKNAVVVNMALLFTVACVFLAAGWPHVAVGFASLGIGSMNSIFERRGEVSLALTYMTGTLVKMGQRLVDTLFGGSHAAWLQHFLIASALGAGALVGGFCYLWLELNALYLATALVYAMTVFTVTWRLRGRVTVISRQAPR
ncbi:YoaK family protein [Corynebacterium cystitidis]|uniref:YoaK family protein n=1 Tax=Corynebacterium cystitidis TaxID=35757 RepID=UPI00211ED94E|nr:YoaK family protein [Corynebacterium cystitidis]